MQQVCVLVKASRVFSTIIRRVPPRNVWFTDDGYMQKTLEIYKETSISSTIERKSKNQTEGISEWII